MSSWKDGFSGCAGSGRAPSGPVSALGASPQLLGGLWNPGHDAWSWLREERPPEWSLDPSFLALPHPGPFQEEPWLDEEGGSGSCGAQYWEAARRSSWGGGGNGGCGLGVEGRLPSGQCCPVLCGPFPPGVSWELVLGEETPTHSVGRVSGGTTPNTLSTACGCVLAPVCSGSGLRGQPLWAQPRRTEAQHHGRGRGVVATRWVPWVLVVCWGWRGVRGWVSPYVYMN